MLSPLESPVCDFHQRSNLAYAMKGEIHYTISHSALPQSTITSFAQEGPGSQKIWLGYLPEGMSLGEFLPKWHALDYGATSTESGEDDFTGSEVEMEVTDKTQLPLFVSPPPRCPASPQIG